MFNFRKVANLEAEVARLGAEKAGADAVLSVTRELLERQLSHLTSQLRETQEELAQARGKISLMETVMMPLSSNAGAAYAEVLHPRTETLRPIIDAPISEWQRYKLAKEKELEDSYAAEEKQDA